MNDTPNNQNPTTENPTTDDPTTDDLSTLALTRLAQSVESLQPPDAGPAWAEIIGPLHEPQRVRWHPDPHSMMGFVAPPECHALASVGLGWGRNMTDDEVHLLGGPESSGSRGPGGALKVEEPQPLLAPGERRRVRVVCLVTRTGAMAGYMRAGSTVLIDTPPTAGRIPDCLRRCFRLPTEPPPEPTDGFLARLWLSNVRGAGQRAIHPLDWPEVVGLHPAMQALAVGGLAYPDCGPLVPALRTAASIWTWTYLVGQAALPGWLASFLPPGARGWMDEGILSRWLLSSVSGVDELLTLVTPLVAPGVDKRLRRTLRELRVLSSSSVGAPSPSRAQSRADARRSGREARARARAR